MTTAAPQSIEDIAMIADWAIRRLSLDLSGLTVYTEAATGPFALTAGLAGRAGSPRVIALLPPGPQAEAAEKETMAAAQALGVGHCVRIVAGKNPEDLALAHVITNLGPVRPIDAWTVDSIASGAVVAYMREAWEARPGEVDLSACCARRIPVFATDEHHPDVDLFAACGTLAAKLLFEAGCELWDAPITVVSGDLFGPVITRALVTLGARVRLLDPGEIRRDRNAIGRPRIVVVADFCASDWIVHAEGCLRPEALAELMPGGLVLAFAGGVDAAAVASAGLRCWPESGCAPGRMGRTLAHLGPRPTAVLHAAGLKVGAVAARAMAHGLAGEALINHVLQHSPAQEMR